MLPDKAAFFFPGAPEGADLDDPAVRRSVLVKQEPPDEDEDADRYTARIAVWQMLADQVATDDPPEVWAAAQRMKAAGASREMAFWELSMALAPRLEAALEAKDGKGYDPEPYRRALDALPLPRPSQIFEKLTELCQALQPVSEKDLVERAMAELGLAVPGTTYGRYVESALDHLQEEEMLTFLGDDQLVEPGSFCAGTVLTHRLSQEEVDGGYVELGADLVDFAPYATVTGPDGAELEDIEVDLGAPAWEGEKGWLAAFPAGTVFAALLGRDSVELSVLDEAPPLRPEAVEAVTAAYQGLGTQGERALPADVEGIFLSIMATDKALFAQPQAPMSDLLAAAGLEVRGQDVAHDQRQWANLARATQIIRVIQTVEDEDDASAVNDALGLFAEDDWQDAAALRGVLALMASRRRLAELLSAELLGWPKDRLAGEPGQAARAAEFARRLAEVARKPFEVSVARWLQAVVAQYYGDLDQAEAHLRLAVASGSGWPLAVDYLAWYLSDRGHAAGAAELWRSTGYDLADPELSVLERYLPGPAAKVGRNEPCWCGSGRKYKQCHLRAGQPELVPLPARVPWLMAKAANFVARNRERAALDVARVAIARRPDDDPAEIAHSITADPLVIDLVLNECGWWGRFVSERGPLLPDDEALLAATWALVERTVYEVLSTRPGHAVTVKDLRTGDEIEVSERTFSRDARPGQLVCGRAVPDGQAHQFVGAMFEVKAGQEAALLDVLDEGAPEAIADWAAALFAPPTMATREGEPMVICTAVFELAHPAQARLALDRLYEPSDEDEATWQEILALSDDERVVRATLRMAGKQLTVETTSAARMDRVLAQLEKAIPERRLLSDKREPFDLSKGPPPSLSGLPPAGMGAGAALPPEVLEQVQDRFERRWCDEQVPALAGLTPRQAAADPTRRESLERLLNEFEQHEARAASAPVGFVGMRTAKLRQMLGLPDA